jgi:hypothetical protein
MGICKTHYVRLAEYYSHASVKKVVSDKGKKIRFKKLLLDWSKDKTGIEYNPDTTINNQSMKDVFYGVEVFID